MFETDMLVLTKSGYATAFEIKVTLADLKKDLNKRHIIALKLPDGKRRYFGRLKYFNYAVPENLKEAALAQIPDFCGLWVYEKGPTPKKSRFYEARKPQKLFDFCWTSRDQHYLAKLGAMRLYGLKMKIRDMKL